MMTEYRDESHSDCQRTAWGMGCLWCHCLYYQCRTTNMACRVSPRLRESQLLTPLATCPSSCHLSAQLSAHPCTFISKKIWMILKKVNLYLESGKWFMNGTPMHHTNNARWKTPFRKGRKEEKNEFPLDHFFAEEVNRSLLFFLTRV